MHRLAVGLRQPVGGIDGGMRRDVEKQQLAGARHRESRASVPPCAVAAAWGRTGGPALRSGRSGAASRWRWRARNRRRAAADAPSCVQRRIERSALAQNIGEDRPALRRVPGMPSLTPRDRVGRGGWPAMARSRAMRSSVEGWLENSPASTPPCSGLMMNICAVAGLASASGLSVTAAARSIFCSADASQSGRPEISAPMRSASNSRVRLIAICTSMAAIGARTAPGSGRRSPADCAGRRRRRKTRNSPASRRRRRSSR